METLPNVALRLECIVQVAVIGKLLVLWRYLCERPMLEYWPGKGKGPKILGQKARATSQACACCRETLHSVHRDSCRWPSATSICRTFCIRSVGFAAEMRGSACSGVAGEPGNVSDGPCVCMRDFFCSYYTCRTVRCSCSGPSSVTLPAPLHACTSWSLMCGSDVRRAS